MVLSLLEVLIISQSPAALNCRERYNLGILFHCVFFSPDAKEEQEKKIALLLSSKHRKYLLTQVMCKNITE